jgi:hypothetical protein
MPHNGWTELSKPQNPEAGVSGFGVVVVVTTLSVLSVSVRVLVLRKYFVSPWQALAFAIER